MSTVPTRPVEAADTGRFLRFTLQRLTIINDIEITVQLLVIEQRRMRGGERFELPSKCSSEGVVGDLSTYYPTSKSHYAVQCSTVVQSAQTAVSTSL